MDIGELLAFGVKNRCSGLYLPAGLPPMIRVDGDVCRINVPAMDHKEAMSTSGQRGMQTFDMALHNLYKEGRIELEEALSNADSRSNLEAKINFG